MVILICESTYMYILQRVQTQARRLNYGTTLGQGITQVNRMSRSRRVLATGGKQRIYGLGMVCIETILYHLDSF